MLRPTRSGRRCAALLPAAVIALAATACDDGEGGDPATTSTLAGADGTTFLGTAVESEPPDPGTIDDYCADVDAYLAAVVSGAATPEQLHELGVRSLELERAMAGATTSDRERFRSCGGRLTDLGQSP